MGRIQGKIALVTGAAQGVGLATTRRFLEEGAIVIMSDKNETLLQERAIALGCQFVAQDVSDEASWKNLIADIEANHGRLDILVNNAAICMTVDVREDTLENWRLTHAVNTESVFLAIKHALPLMEKTGGSIVNMSSVAAINGNPLTPAYAASKAAVRALSQSVALNCLQRRSGVRCNTVHPDAIDPPMLPAEITGTDREELLAVARQWIGGFRRESTFHQLYFFHSHPVW